MLAQSCGFDRTRPGSFGRRGDGLAADAEVLRGRDELVAEVEIPRQA